MKALVRDILISAFVGLVVPGMILNHLASFWEAAGDRTVQQQDNSSVSLSVRVRNGQGAVVVQDMDAYLVGVLLAEMPARFETEALKAQSVVARTYAWKAYTTGGKHGDGSVCKEPACCQGYRDREEYLDQGGREEDLKKICDAVYATSGQVLAYQGELIEATYFSCSGGRTEEARAVWGGDFPYLQAVDSPGEEGAAHFRDTVFFSVDMVEAALGVRLDGPWEEWIGQTTRTEGGGVDTVVIGGSYFTGLELRQKLGLNSTAFFLWAEESGLWFETSGYGHRVGMSQYGADAMAAAGSTYGEILAHYYPGTELTQPEEE